MNLVRCICIHKHPFVILLPELPSNPMCHKKHYSRTRADQGFYITNIWWYLVFCSRFSGLQRRHYILLCGKDPTNPQKLPGTNTWGQNHRRCLLVSYRPQSGKLKKHQLFQLWKTLLTPFLTDTQGRKISVILARMGGEEVLQSYHPAENGKREKHNLNQGGSWKEYCGQIKHFPNAGIEYESKYRQTLLVLWSAQRRLSRYHCRATDHFQMHHRSF